MWKMNTGHMAHTKRYTTKQCFVHSIYAPGFSVLSLIARMRLHKLKTLIIILVIRHDLKGFELRKKLYFQWAADMNYTRNANKLKSFTHRITSRFSFKAYNRNVRNGSYLPFDSGLKEFECRTRRSKYLSVVGTIAGCLIFWFMLMYGEKRFSIE